MKRILWLIPVVLLALALQAHAGQTREISKTLTADENFDISDVNAGGPVDSMTLYSDGVDGGGTLTFQACITTDSGSCKNILDVSGSGVSCTGSACTCTAACAAQVKSHGTGPYKIYRMALSGSASPTLVLKALVYRE